MHVINTIKVGASVPNEKVAGGYQTTTATSKECTPIFPRSEGEGNIQPMHLPQQARQVGVPVAKHGRAQEKGLQRVLQRLLARACAAFSAAFAKLKSWVMTWIGLSAPVLTKAWSLML